VTEIENYLTEQQIRKIVSLTSLKLLLQQYFKLLHALKSGF